MDEGRMQLDVLGVAVVILPLQADSALRKAAFIDVVFARGSRKV